MAKAKVSEFIPYIHSKVGSAYLWGGQGETLFDLARKLARQNSQSEENTKLMIAFMKSQGRKDIEFFDCSGLAVSYLLPAGAISSDMTANGFYSLCKKIDRKDARKGDMVFLLNSLKKASHIGYIVDKNTIVHALNQSRGVVEEKLNKRNWVFGRPDFCLEYDLEDESEISVDNLTAGDKVTLAKAVSGYRTAADALAGKSPVTAYSSGTYYVYRVYEGAVNITRTKGVPGAWVVL